MANEKKIDLFPRTPPPDAGYMRRLFGIAGITSVIGRSLRTIMRLSGMSEDEPRKADSEAEENGIDRTASELFISEAERAFREYAGTRRDPQETLTGYQALTAAARNNPGSRESIDAMVEIYKNLRRIKQTGDVARNSELLSAINSALRKALPQVVKKANLAGQRRRAGS